MVEQSPQSEMGFGLLFVPLVGGYLFLTWCHWTRFTVRRQSGHHLLFWSASVGLVLLAGARVVELLFSDVVQSWPYLVDLWQRVAPFTYVGTIALAFLLGPCGALVINRFHSESSGALRAVHRAGNSLQLLFIEAMYSDSTVELTLDSGKAYVGWILNAAVAEPERKFVEMLPLASGFRTQETHKNASGKRSLQAASPSASGGDTAGPSGFRVRSRQVGGHGRCRTPKRRRGVGPGDRRTRPRR